MHGIFSPDRFQIAVLAIMLSTYPPNLKRACIPLEHPTSNYRVFVCVVLAHKDKKLIVIINRSYLYDGCYYEI